MEETISLKEIFEVIKKRFLLITAFILGAALIAAVVSYFVLTPSYESSSQFIVNQGEQDQNTQNSVNDAWTNTEIINTYNVIITSPAILDEVVEELSLPYSSGTLASKIQVGSEQDSQVVTVTATDESASMAVQLANTTVSVFQENIPEILSVDNVTILSQAELAANPSPVAPNPMLNIAIAIVLGGMIGVGLAFLLEYLDNTITSEDDIEKKLELPVLGVISHIEDKDIREGQFQFKPKQNQQSRGGGYNETQKKSV
jgi:capsular polysaccharide biosynthesis protein